MPVYASVKNELCTMGKTVLRGNRIVIPEEDGAKVSTQGTSRNCEDKE